jgi:hypothetical protein
VQLAQTPVWYSVSELSHSVKSCLTRRKCPGAAQIKFAILQNKPAMTAAEFFVI